MIRVSRAADPSVPAVRRLARLAPLSAFDLQVLTRAAAGGQDYAARRDLLREGYRIEHPLLITEGWAARVRVLPDGRRQFLSFLLPGDLIGLCRHARPLAVATVVALSDVRAAPLPPPGQSAGLREAYAVSQALEAAYLLSHVTRLGRLNAQERIADFLLELHERLSLAGLTLGHDFELPLTQELLADAVGLTSVHVNRMLQAMRHNGDLAWRQGRVTLVDPAGLARKVGRVPVRVSERAPGD